MRPTGNRTRESLFNIITHGLAGWEGELEDASVVDLFCGTGALGLEALSRGAAHVTLVDNSVSVLSVVQKKFSTGYRDGKSELPFLEWTRLGWHSPSLHAVERHATSPFGPALWLRFGGAGIRVAKDAWLAFRRGTGGC